MFRSKKLRLLVSTAITVVSLTSYSFAATYSVVPGDTLYIISQLFNTNVSKLYADNNLSSSMIYPGQKLKVQAATHTVESGDTLYLISKDYGTSLYSLRKANNKWDNYLYVNQELVVPTANTAQTAALASTRAASDSVIPYSQQEFDLLARLITAEATGQPYDAQVAVGSVVVNRVKSKSFPNSISSVIYQVINGYYQFTPVLNGYINNPASETAKKAAYDALGGADPSFGALFYFDDSATNTWLWSKPIKARIGKMVYVE